MRINAFKIINQTMPPSHLWPHKLRRLVYEYRTITEKQRFALSCFLLNNGFPPEKLVFVLDTLYRLDSFGRFKVTKLLGHFMQGVWKYNSWLCYENRSSALYIGRDQQGDSITLDRYPRYFQSVLPLRRRVRVPIRGPDVSVNYADYEGGHN